MIRTLRPNPAPRRSNRAVKEGQVRFIVCLALDENDPSKLSPARLHNFAWTHGGHRELHELAVAAAAAGYQSEVRGDFDRGMLEEMCAAAGAKVGTPDLPSSPEPGDIICVPDGIRDPTFFIRVALMVSTPIFIALAPPGLFGWSFTPGWRYVEALDVDPQSVGQPAHYGGISSLGYEVWTNCNTIAAEFGSAGIEATVLYDGIPTRLPPEPEKDVDVVTLSDNRWAPLTRQALRGFTGTWRELPMMPNSQLIAELGRGRIFVHCARIEGHSRLGFEARLMGTCCVGLSSNRFAIGFDDQAGGAMVERVEDVASRLQEILSNPDELKQRQARARTQAIAETEWDSYVERVSRAIAAAQSKSKRQETPWGRVAADMARQIEVERKIAADLAGQLEVEIKCAALLRMRNLKLKTKMNVLRNRRSVRVANAVSRLLRAGRD